MEKDDRFSVFVLFILLFSIAGGVNRKDFRVCEETDFCKKYRDGSKSEVTSIPSYFLQQNSSSLSTYGEYRADLTRNAANFTLFLQIRQDGIIHMHIEDQSPRRRYRLSVPEVIQPFYPLLIPDITLRKGFSSDSESIHWISDQGQRFSIIIHYQPFFIHLLRNDTTCLIINGHQKLVIETPSLPLENPDQFFSVCLDVTFMGSDVFGIPEHATHLSLTPTLKTNASHVLEPYFEEPYRLYNLDVFEYEIYNPMSLYGSVPMMMSMDAELGGAGFFFANPSETWIDVRKENDPHEKIYTHWMSKSASMEAYFFLADTPASILKQFIAVTGNPMMPPLFSLAYHQSRWNYESEKDVLSVQSGFDKNDIALDVLWLDIGHTNGNRYLTWHLENFVTPLLMQASLSENQRKLVTIVDPHIKVDKSYSVYSQALAGDHFVRDSHNKTFEGYCWPGASSWIDFTSPAARNWWISQLSLKGYPGSTLDLYVWNDMNEPSVFNGREITMPVDNIHYMDQRHGDLHNVYGFYQHMASHEAINRRNNGRSFVLSRSFFAGSQKFGAIWTGDNRADWNHLKISIPMLLTIGLSGLPFIGADVGGFFGNPEPLLLLRWYQLAAFTPFFRGHSHIETKRREPWLFDRIWVDHIRTAIRLRYSLLPYWYTLFYEASLSGLPPMRPLFFEHPTESNTYSIDHGFYLGKSLIVFPVLESGLERMEISLPGRNKTWYNYMTLEQIKSPSSFSLPIDLGTIPVFLKSGSILCLKNRPRRSSDLMHNDPYTILIILDKKENKAIGTLYIDDGISFNHHPSEYQYREIIASYTEPFQWLNISSRCLSGSSSEYIHVKPNFVVTPLSGRVEKITIVGWNRSSIPLKILLDNHPVTDLIECKFGNNTHDTIHLKLPLMAIDKDWTLVLQ